MPSVRSRVQRRVPSPKPPKKPLSSNDTSIQTGIKSYYNKQVEEVKKSKRLVLRDITYGITVGHLRRCARLGGSILLGECAFNTLVCEICHSGADDENMILCDKCNKGYHLYCLKPILPSVPSDDWYCDNCRKKDKHKYLSNKKALESSQSLIVDFFKLTKPIPVVSRYNMRQSTRILEQPKCVVTVNSPKPKGKGYLKCYVPSTDPYKIKNQHVALASAMFQQNIAYSYELIYKEGCSPSMNNVRLDEERHLLREMCESDRKVYNETIRLSKEGFMAPVVVRQDDIQGFVVVADEEIAKDTLITEYIGEVDILEKNEQNSNDSIMDLLRSGDPSTSLVIIPDRYGNVARYLSGINNSSKESKKKQNVRSARYVIDGCIHVLLIALRDIHPGELLTFDYNALDHNYPTEHFI